MRKGLQEKSKRSKRPLTEKNTKVYLPTEEYESKVRILNQ